jgi:TDG/mug DNA glycosylase family protein
LWLLWDHDPTRSRESTPIGERSLERLEPLVLRAALRPRVILPDVIAPGLRIVFCGTAAGTASAARGAYYAGPGNKFWPTLHAIGLTPRQLAPEEFAGVLEFGLGLTDVCKLASGSDREVGTRAFDVDGLVAKIAANAPRVIAFNGVNAGRAALGAFAGYGRQPAGFAGAEAWILPSTSGAASGFWDPEPWRQLATDSQRA